MVSVNTQNFNFNSEILIFLSAAPVDVSAAILPLLLLVNSHVSLKLIQPTFDMEYIFVLTPKTNK